VNLDKNFDWKCSDFDKIHYQGSQRPHWRRNAKVVEERLGRFVAKSQNW